MFGVSQPRSCNQFGIKNRGTIEPPTADQIRITKLETVKACLRVLHSPFIAIVKVEALSAKTNTTENNLLEPLVPVAKSIR